VHLPLKVNDLSHILTVRTRTLSSGKYTYYKYLFLTQVQYISAHIAKWIAESNRPATITSDPELIDILTTGHPNLKVPSPGTVRRDVNAAYLKCRERITKLLQDHPGLVHFATDAWTSNNTQGEALAGMDNSFESEHRVHCFNHALQLSAKTLLRPLNAGLGKATEDGDDDDVEELLDLDTDDDGGENEGEDEDGEDGVGDEGEDEDEDEDLLVPGDADDIDDGIDELDALGPDAREEVLADTAAVREVATKLRRLALTVVRSTTIALAWRRYCKEHELKSRIFPRDVVTRWDSTYYILNFAIKYRTVIDAMTADKSLKLRRFELEMEEWAIA